MTREQTRPGSPDTSRTWLCWTMILGWSVIVAFVAMRHEFWRDEVRALSLAMDARSLSELPTLLKDEGHPMLWYVLLWSAFRMTSSKLVLPGLSLLIAGAAVTIFIFRAPFPHWIKALFVFSGLPLYEYSVMARNYGISMLLLFLFAWLYRLRRKRPLLLGTVVALLCNTNIHSLLLGSGLMTLWAWDLFARDRAPLLSRQAGAFAVAVAIAAAGAGAALLTLWPTPDAAASDPARYTVSNVIQAVSDTVLDPAGSFELIAPRVPGMFGFIGGVLLIGSALGLIRRPAALCVALAGLLELSVLFRVVYPGGYRHQGLFVVFVVTLYWIVLMPTEMPQAEKGSGYVGRAGLYVCLPVLLSILVVTGWHRAYEDVMHEESASRSFGSFLHSHPEYADAILIGEPDFALESVHYYVDNPIYIARERRFGTTVRFVRGTRQRLSLGELLRVAQEVQTREKKDVLIALGHLQELDPAGRVGSVASVKNLLRGTFSWSPEDLRAWAAGTQPLQRFADNVIGDERYTIYGLIAHQGG